MGILCLRFKADYDLAASAAEMNCPESLIYIE